MCIFRDRSWASRPRISPAACRTSSPSAKLEEFIDSPVKHYSSGMYLRLGFAIGIHVQPDILLIDEILAVGDQRFQRRCKEYIRGLRDSGKTILVVSHDLDAILSLCFPGGGAAQGANPGRRPPVRDDRPLQAFNLKPAAGGNGLRRKSSGATASARSKSDSSACA